MAACFWQAAIFVDNFYTLHIVLTLMKRVFFLFLATLTISILGASALQAQNSSKLADQYYLDGEYEKAAELYHKLYIKANRNDYYFSKYIECLLALEQYEESEAIIREQIAENPGGVSLYVTLGNVLERQNEYEEAEEVYSHAIDNLPADVAEIAKLGNAFLLQTKYDLAIETFEKGQDLLKRPGLFANNLADLYRRKGDKERMIENYLYTIDTNPKRLQSVQTIFQRYLSKSDFDILREQLYGLIQDNPDADYYPEMLAWVFIQQRDFKQALRQVKALDIRFEENGQRVYQLARMAANARDYDVAIEGFEYIVNEKGESSPFYIESKRRSLAAERDKIVRNYLYTDEQLRDVEAKYESFLDEFGKNRATASIIAELAELEAFYINDLDKAIALLDEVISYPGVNPKVLAQAKLDLADFHLMTGEIWEATLLYSQVDKAFREDPLGEEARFRNARLSYFNSDFNWAQEQFDILKASTSKMISNDAIDMSVFIMDNLGLDTTEHALSEYAQAELLVFQNRFDEAIEKLTILSNIYPDHGLQDDIIYLKAQIYEERREFDKAVEAYRQIIDEYPDEIRADNAMFNLASMYEYQLDSPGEAQILYERLFIEYSDSTFSIEARKRFRTLRGDFDSDEPIN